MVVHQTHYLGHGQAQEHSDPTSPNHAHDKLAPSREEIEIVTLGYSQKNSKKHHSHAVIEDALALDYEREPPSHSKFFEKSQDRDGIGGGDNGTKKERMSPGKVWASFPQLKTVIGNNSSDSGG